MNPFQELPANFFMPLASMHRMHYASLLLIYYNLFLEYHTGVERKLVAASFEEYFSKLGDPSLFSGSGSKEEKGEQNLLENWENELITDEARTGEPISPRSLATLFLRRLIHYKWMLEEVLSDFTQLINIPSWAKPFYLALTKYPGGVRWNTKAISSVSMLPSVQIRRKKMAIMPYSMPITIRVCLWIH